MAWERGYLLALTRKLILAFAAAAAAFYSSAEAGAASIGIQRMCAEILALPKLADIYNVDKSARQARFCSDKIEIPRPQTLSLWEGPAVIESKAREFWRARAKSRLMNLSADFEQRSRRRSFTPDWVGWDYNVGELDRYLNITRAHLVHPKFSKDAIIRDRADKFRDARKWTWRIGLTATAFAALLNYRQPHPGYENMTSAFGILTASAIGFLKLIGKLEGQNDRDRVLDDTFYTAGRRIVKIHADVKLKSDWLYAGRTLVITDEERAERLSDLQRDHLERAYSSSDREKASFSGRDGVLNFIRFLQGRPEGAITLESDSFYDRSTDRVYQWFRYVTPEEKAPYFKDSVPTNKDRDDDRYDSSPS